MIIAAAAAIPSSTKDRHGRRKHKARNSRVGQIAKPVPKLKEATKPAHNTIRVAGNDRSMLTPIFGRRRKARTAPTVTKEHIQLNPPDPVIGPRPIQKLPTITTRVAMTLAVRPTVLSRQTGISSSVKVRKSSISPAMKSNSWSPWKKRRSASQKKLEKNIKCSACLSSELSSQVWLRQKS